MKKLVSESLEDALSKEKTLHKRLIEDKDGIKIYAVNGDYVRDKDPGLDFPQFVEGGSHYPTSYPGYKKYIPEDEIWIDDVHLLKPNDLQAIILHELVERNLMKNHGVSYDDAHEIANKAETLFRKNVHKGSGIKVRDIIYNKFKDKKRGK